jgi:hypothetical protein
VARFRALRRANEAMQPAMSAQRNELLHERAGLLAGLHHNDLARHREYPFVLHSESRLRAVFTRTLSASFDP